MGDDAAQLALRRKRRRTPSFDKLTAAKNGAQQHIKRRPRHERGRSPQPQNAPRLRSKSPQPLPLPPQQHAPRLRSKSPQPAQAPLPQRRPTVEQRDSDYCYICKKRGHYAKRCPAEKRAACFVCGRFNHTGRHCPSKLRGTEKRHSAELDFEELCTRASQSRYCCAVWRLASPPAHQRYSPACAFVCAVLFEAESERLSQIRSQFRTSLMPKMNPFS